MPEIPASGPQIDVIALVVSAGGLEALTAVLRELPQDLRSAVVVAQHLGGQASQLVPILGRRIALPVQWAQDGEAIAAGRVTVCPPSSVLEILPDRTCSLRKGGATISSRPLDRLLASVADSFGPRALGVVLTGMGRDGAAGARALKEAGGTVIVQSEDTAEQPSMPRAAVAMGAADLVLPLHEIGRVVADIASGGRLPQPWTETEAVEALFAGPGRAREQLRAVDWAATPLGPVTKWPEPLRTIVRTALASRFPILVFWGPEYVQIANDGFLPSFGEKLAVQGVPARVVWAELWDYLRTEWERIGRTGEATWAEDQLFEPNRRGFVEEAYFTYSYSPLYDGTSAFAGILATQTETTPRVLAERRLATLRALSEAVAGVASTHEACARAAAVLAGNPYDVPFALVYLLDEVRSRASLAAAAGPQPGTPVAPQTVNLRGGRRPGSGGGGRCGRALPRACRRPVARADPQGDGAPAHPRDR